MKILGREKKGPTQKDPVHREQIIKFLKDEAFSFYDMHKKRKPSLMNHIKTKKMLRSMLIVGFDGYLRAGEIIDLRWEDIDDSEDRWAVTIRKRKTDQAGNGFKVVLSNTGTKTLENYRFFLKKMFDEDVTSGRMFSIKYTQFKRYFHFIADYYNWPGTLGLHSIRIGAACSHIRNGGTVEQAALLGGWSDLKMPMYYGKQALKEQAGFKD